MPEAASPSSRAPTVRQAALAALRHCGLTTVFANPGSTEVPFLVDLPDDIEFVLALHEASVVGIATGHALATGHPALALLHTTAGLGNAVGAMATARVNRAPLVVLVGQQDRRHLALEPFLTGRLEGLAGDYPLAVVTPVWAADVPSAIRRAAHTATAGRGPVVVIVPMDDWDAPADPAVAAAPQRLVAAPPAALVPPDLDELVSLLNRSTRPAILAGAGVDSERGWAAVASLADRMGAGVWSEPFGARAGFDQTHKWYAGQLPADRTRLRDALAPHDLLLVLGAAAIRQYPYDTGPLVPDHTRLVVVSSDIAEVTRSPADLSAVADPVATAEALAERLPERAGEAPPRREYPAYTLDGSGVLHPEDVFSVLAEHLPSDTVLLEESPSSRPALQEMVPARTPMGFLSAAMGGLGFALPAAIGVRMASPHRPVVAVVGDGSSLYAVQSLWTAAHHAVGVLVLVLANGRYAVMDRLADRRGGTAPWPAFPEVSVARIAEGLGVRAERISTHAELAERLPALCRTLADRAEPLLLEVSVEAGTTFQP